MLTKFFGTCLDIGNYLWHMLTEKQYLAHVKFLHQAQTGTTEIVHIHKTTVDIKNNK